MKHIFLYLFLLVCSITVSAQNVSDAVRFSNLQPGGTARFLGVGGAFGALGADFGVVSTNPAGLAMFRTNEMIFTPALNFRKTEATMNGAGNEAWTDTKSNFNFNNIGLVFNSEPRAAKWTNFNFGIGFNRQQNYNQSIYYEGNAPGSVLNNWYDEAAQTINGGGSENELDPFGAKMAYDANAIYYQDGAISYDFGATPDAVVHRNQGLISTGGINEMAFSFAGNYDEKLMVGATIGVPFVNYRLDGTYEESDPGDAVDYFDNLTYTEYLRTNGVGINLKMGVIFRLSQMIRLGGAFHTPTFMSLTDKYSNTFSYTYTDGNGTASNTGYSPDGTSDYKLRTPWRAIASGAVVINKFGFVSADVEWVDYSASRYNFTSDISNSSNEQYEREINNSIQRQLKQSMNVRIGGELAVDAFRFRAGVNLLGKPYEGQTGFNTAYTAGVGLRSESFYLDLGYRRTLNSGTVSPYNGAPLTSLDTKANDFMMTLGFKF